MNRPLPLTETEIRDSGIPRYELLEWRNQFGLVAGVTAKGEGLDFKLDAEAATLRERWTDLKHGLGGQFQSVVIGRQEHTANVIVHRERSRPWTLIPGIDGHLTRLKGTLLLATVADCVPVYLAHPYSGTIALLHAGWRGIAAGILEIGLAEFLKLAQAPPGECVMHCGVSICGECYEVGPEVLSALGLAATAGRNVDLRSLIAERAVELGVRAVTLSTWCTAHYGNRFYSHRAQGPRAGRMLAYLGVPERCPELASRG